MRTLTIPNLSKLKDSYKSIDRKKLGIYIIVILSILRFVIYPMKEEVKKDKEKLNSKLQEYMEDIKLYTSKKIKQPSQSVSNNQISIENLYGENAKSKDIQISLAKIVKKYAKQNNINLQSIEMPKPSKTKYIEQIDIKVRLSTNDPYKVFSLFQYLEAMPKYTVIKETQINTFGGNVNFDFTVSTYKLLRKI
ncbi:MAG: hypothetical protein C0170_07090 [Hydrogenobaculum sp.]|nr:MAG: hypothetical protein C0170_07090 [Hydrogenobaculum sp.]